MPRITGYELYEVPPRWLFLRVETSDGLVGWGEPVVEGRVGAVRGAVEELLEGYLLDEPPGPIEDHWQTMYRGGFYRGGPILMSAIAGIDQALWDIKGKHLGAPVYELLGGPVRERVQVYGWIGGDEPTAVADAAGQATEAGLRALKMNATGKLRHIDTPASVEAAAERLAAVRERVGPEVDVAVDFHGRASKAMAKRLATALEPHDPFFIEEPVRPGGEDALSAIAAHTDTPIATGERLYSRWDFAPVLAGGAVDVVQPDLSHAGGISEVKRIAAMAEAHDVAIAPHCPLGPIALASCLQVDAVAANTLVQEQSLKIHYNETADLLDYVDDPSAFDYGDGYVDLPDGPGLGVSVDEAIIEERAGNVDWHNPVWRHADGSVAEW